MWIVGVTGVSCTAMRILAAASTSATFASA
jgi:hypothetical protein